MKKNLSEKYKKSPNTDSLIAVDIIHNKQNKRIKICLKEGKGFLKIS